MSNATLASLQGALAEIYDLPATPDVARVPADRSRAPRRDVQSRKPMNSCSGGGGRHAVDGAVHRCRSAAAPGAAVIRSQSLTHENLADYLTAAEGVSHFVYVAWNTGFDKPVTLARARTAGRGRQVRARRLAAAARKTPAVFRASCIAHCSTGRASIPWPPRAARACIAWLRDMPRASAAGWRHVWSASVAARMRETAGGAAPFLSFGECPQAGVTSNGTREVFARHVERRREAPIRRRCRPGSGARPAPASA